MANLIWSDYTGTQAIPYAKRHRTEIMNYAPLDQCVVSRGNCSRVEFKKEKKKNILYKFDSLNLLLNKTNLYEKSMPKNETAYEWIGLVFWMCACCVWMNAAASKADAEK